MIDDRGKGGDPRGFPVFARLTHMAGNGRMRAVAEEIDHEREGLVRRKALASVE